MKALPSWQGSSVCGNSSASPSDVNSQIRSIDISTEIKLIISELSGRQLFLNLQEESG